MRDGPFPFLPPAGSANSRHRLLPRPWDKRQFLARDLDLQLGASEEKCPQRSLTERATTPQSQRSARNVVNPAVRAVSDKDEQPFSQALASGPVPTVGRFQDLHDSD